MSPAPICPYCGCPTATVRASYVYGDNDRDPGRMLWFCLICGAYVSCHKTGLVPMGTPANKETRDARRKAHQAFDTLWKSRKMTRWEAYLWLSQKMGLPQDKTHIGMFNISQCTQVVQLCEKTNGGHMNDE